MYSGQWEQSFQVKLSEGFFIQEKNDSFSVPGMQQQWPHLEEDSE